MRLPMVAAILCTGVLLSGAADSAEAEIWCRRDFGRDNPICVFSSLRQCVIGVGAWGGVCERQQSFAPPDPYEDRVRTAPARPRPFKPPRRAYSAPR